MVLRVVITQVVLQYLALLKLKGSGDPDLPTQRIARAMSHFLAFAHHDAVIHAIQTSVLFSARLDNTCETAKTNPGGEKTIMARSRYFELSNSK